MYKNIKGEEIKQLGYFIDRYTLLFGVHVKYIISVFALLIVSLCNFQSDETFSVTLNSCENWGLYFWKQCSQIDCIDLIMIGILVVCITKWIYAYRIIRIIDRCFPLFTKLEIYEWHKTQLESYHEKKTELEMEKNKSVFCCGEVEKQINELQEKNSSEFSKKCMQQNNTLEKHLAEKMAGFRLKIQVIDEKLVTLTETISKLEKKTEEQKKYHDNYEENIEKAVDISGYGVLHWIMKSDKVKIEILFQGIANQLIYQSKQ